MLVAYEKSAESLRACLPDRLFVWSDERRQRLSLAMANDGGSGEAVDAEGSYDGAAAPD